MERRGQGEKEDKCLSILQPGLHRWTNTLVVGVVMIIVKLNYNWRTNIKIQQHTSKILNGRDNICAAKNHQTWRPFPKLCY